MNDVNNALKMDFISSAVLKSQSSIEKISMIMERFIKGEILVIEGGL
jgi:hypothetical protein